MQRKEESMRRTERELTDVEIIDTFEEIRDVMIANSQGEVLPQFQKESRMAQLGWRITQIMLKNEMMETGFKDPQEKLKV